MSTDQAPRGPRARRARNWPVATLCALALGVIASCDRLPTAPTLSPDLSPRRLIGGGSYTLGVRTTTTVNYGSEGWKNTGIQTRAGLTYVIRVTGSVTASPNTELGCFDSINWSTVPDMGSYGPAEPAPRDQPGGYLGVAIALDSGASSFTLRKTADGTAWESDTLPLATGTLWALRLSGPPAGTNCGDSPPGGGFYALSGSSTITVTEFCPPSQDQWVAPADGRTYRPLDDPAIRQAFEDAMVASNPDSLPGTGKRKETGGIIWRMPDGSIKATLVPDPNATECHTDPFTQMDSVKPDPQAIPLASYHTHPSYDGEDIYGCSPTPTGQRLAQRLGDGLPVPAAAPNDSAAGGGSPADWASTASGPAYTITKNNVVYRLDPNVPRAQRGNNRNRWIRRNLLGCPGMFPV